MTKFNAEPKAGKNNIIWKIALIISINAFLVLFVFEMGKKELSGDELQYNTLATNLIEYSIFSLDTTPPLEPTLYRTPGYPLFLAFFYLLSGNSILIVKLIHFILLGISAYFLYELAKLYVEERTARVACYFFLFYLPFLFFAGFILTETVTIFLILSIFLIIKKYSWQESNSLIFDLIVGIIMGVIVMVRPTTALVTIPLILGLWASFLYNKNLLFFRKCLFKTALFSLGIMIIMMPWIIRNYTIVDQFNFTSGGSSESFYISLLQYNGKISHAFTVQEWKEIYIAGLTKRYTKAEEKISIGDLDTNVINFPKTVQRELLINESYKDSIKDELKETNILNIVKNIPVRVAYLWSTASFAPNSFLHRIAQVQFLIFFCLAILGLILSRRELLSHWLLLLFPIYLTFIHLIFHEEPRYTIPARPFILLYCAIGMVWIWNFFRNRFITKV